MKPSASLSSITPQRKLNKKKASNEQINAKTAIAIGG